VNADQLADAPSGCRTGIGRRLDGTDIAANEDRYVTGSDVFLADQLNVRSLDHSIGRLNRSYETFGFHHTERF
jgi:hypothetical protein